jgi:hypothetical protein
LLIILKKFILKAKVFILITTWARLRDDTREFMLAVKLANALDLLRSVEFIHGGIQVGVHWVEACGRFGVVWIVGRIRK